MTLKVYELVICITGAVGAIAIGLVTYFNPAYASAIAGSIEIATTAIASICALFLNKEQSKLGK